MGHACKRRHLARPPVRVRMSRLRRFDDFLDRHMYGFFAGLITGLLAAAFRMS